DVVGVTASAHTVAASITLSSDPRFALVLGGSGTRFNGSAWALGGRTSAALRAPLADAFALTLNAGASMTSTSYQNSYAFADAIPAAEARVGALTLFGGAHAAQGRATIHQQSAAT